MLFRFPEHLQCSVDQNGPHPDSFEPLCRGRHFYFTHANKFQVIELPGNVGGKGAVLCLLERLAAVILLCQKLGGDEHALRELA